MSSISVNGISTIIEMSVFSISIRDVSSSSNEAFKKSKSTPVLLAISISSSSEGATIFIQQPVRYYQVVLMLYSLR